MIDSARTSVQMLREREWGPEPSERRGVRRIRLRDVRTEPDGELYVEVTVELEVSGEILTEELRDADTPRGRMLAAARATLNALTPTLDEQVAFVLEGLEEFSIAETPAVLAILRARARHSRPSFHGSAIVRRNPEEAAVRAVLDALNRFSG